MISDGYGIAIPESGIAMGAVFENVAIPTHGGVGLGRLGWVLRPWAAIPASATTPAMMNESKQRIRCNPGRVNVSFVFAIIQLPVPLV